MSDNDDGPPKNPGGFQKGFDPRRNITNQRKKLINGRTIPDLCRDYGPAAIETCVTIMMNAKSRDRDRLAAAKELLDRGYGTVAAIFKVEGTVNHNHAVASVDFTQLSVDALRQLMAARVEQPETILIESSREPDDDHN